MLLLLALVMLAGCSTAPDPAQESPPPAASFATGTPLQATITPTATEPRFTRNIQPTSAPAQPTPTIAPPTPMQPPATTAPSSSATGWKPVPAPVTPGAPRVTPLVDDPAARTRACGAWDAQATAKDGWTQRDCVARLAAGDQGKPAPGAGVFITKVRWSMVAAAYGLPRTPGPDPETWVIVVRFDYPDTTSVTIILDDGTGAPYLRIDHA